MRLGLGSPDWIVIREGQHQRWGGELRRRRIFARLAERTGAAIVEGRWTPGAIARAARGPLLGAVPVPVLSRLPGTAPRRDRPRLAASEKLRGRLLDAAVAVSDPCVVAVYDDPIAQPRALGVTLDPAWTAELASRQQRNVAAFRWLVAPTRSFAELAGLPPERTIVGGNGTDVERVRVAPWPDVPAIGMVSAGAPGRGIELLVDAARLARDAMPELRLFLWLVATNDASAAYIDEVRRVVAGDAWVSVATAPYDRLGETLGAATVLAIPHPPGEYMDVALPVKLFDSMAAGRPLVVTPRVETAAVVRRLDVGVVADGDSADDLAAAALRLLGDTDATRAAGARARAAAEREFDWRIVGDRIADEVLRREGEGRERP